MDNIILELSRYTADEKISNAEWKNTMSKPLKIEQGDSIMVKQCFVDTRLIDQTSILIEEDVYWTLQFCYYVMCHGINQFTLSRGEGPNIDFNSITPDGMPYILSTYYDAANDTYQNVTFPYIDSFTINIPAGIYERSYLATYITKQMQTIKQPQNITIKGANFTNGQVMPIFDEAGVCTGFYKTPFYPPSDSSTIITPFQKPSFAVYTIEDLLLVYEGFKDSYGNFNLGSLNRMVNSDKYNPNGFITFANDDFQTVININNVQYAAVGGGYIGASQVALTYNDNNSNRFAFQYIHSPLINNGNECIGKYTLNKNTNSTDDNIIFHLDSYSGILFCNTFTNMSDDSNNDPFLNQLGFKYNDIISPDIKNLWIKDFETINTGLMDYNNFLKYTTKNFYPLSATSDISKTSTVGNYKITNYSPIYYDISNSGYDFQDSNITDEIIGSNPPISSNISAGHFELEIIGAYNTEYISQIKDYNIKEIIGNYFYTSDSFSMTLGPSSIIYTHQGVPITLQSLMCRILNPINKQIEKNLGPNSTIYLQVIKDTKNQQMDTEQEKNIKKTENK